jgi:N-acetylglutamate synthase-like GNAT family acetyltransferase
MTLEEKNLNYTRLALMTLGIDVSLQQTDHIIRLVNMVQKSMGQTDLRQLFLLEEQVNQKYDPKTAGFTIKPPAQQSLEFLE